MAQAKKAHGTPDGAACPLRGVDDAAGDALRA
jgi:hypothetical protein